MICISHATAAEQCHITGVSPRGTTELKRIINVPADSNNCYLIMQNVKLSHKAI